MGVEVLIYIYLTVCLAMIIFNIGTILISMRRERLSERRAESYRRLISSELERIREVGEADPKHYIFMKRMLRRSEQLLVFIQVMLKLFGTFPEEGRIYMKGLNPVLVGLGPHYVKRSDLTRYAFYLYSIREFEEMSGELAPGVSEILLPALRVPNTYCRENALQAVYYSGDIGLVIKALQLIDAEKIKHNRKLMSEGLLKFSGSKKGLIDRLWEVFEGFGISMQEILMDFFRFSAPSHRDDIFAIFIDENRNPELRFSCIRYFAKYTDKEAYPVLLKMAGDIDNKRWEFPAIACTALASYPGEQTVETLKRALCASNWYIRYNAAESLTKLGTKYIDLLEVIDGSDRYAHDIIQFHLDMLYNQRK